LSITVLGYRLCGPERAAAAAAPATGFVPEAAAARGAQNVVPVAAVAQQEWRPFRRRSAFSAPPASPVPTVIPSAIGPVAPAQNLFTPVDANIIKWDAETKEHSAKLGDARGEIHVLADDVSPSEVLVNSVRTSCGCTVAKLPVAALAHPAGFERPDRLSP